VAYNSLLIERRKVLHEHAGAAIEALYDGRLDDHLSELARHYQRSANTAKALKYLGRAGQQALQRSSHAEAIGLFTSGLELLQTLPETPERLERELGLQLGLGPALMMVKGFSAPEVGEAFARMRELCRQIGETPDLFEVLFGLWGFYYVRGELEVALDLAQRLLSIAQGWEDAALLPAAHHAVGNTLSTMGQFIPSQRHLELSVSLYDPVRYPIHAVPHGGINLGVQALYFLARDHWCLGFPDLALGTIERALALARELSLPSSLCVALIGASLLHSLRGEITAAWNFADAAAGLAGEQGFQQFLAYAIALRGEALIQGGQAEAGIAQLSEGIDSVRASGARLGQTAGLAGLAQGHGIVRRVGQGFAALAEAIALVERTGERDYEAELYRLKGELTLKRSEADSNSRIKEQAESYFRRAIEVARRQSAKSLELRAATSLARLLADQGRRDEARTMLAEIYNWFTEGFDTADLKEAKALLEELAT
jgi:tetratricopeptide (TPR) repeat protein